MTGAFVMFRWRIHAARQFMVAAPRQVLDAASAYAALTWAGMAAFSMAMDVASRWALAWQAVVAVPLGLALGLWRLTGRLLDEHRRLAAAARPVLTERLVLRQARSADADDYAAAADEEMMAANGWSEATKGAAVWRVRHADILPSWDLTIIADRVTSEFIGWMVVSKIDSGADSCELGWSLAPQARGKGYATEAVAAAVSALHQSGFRRVVTGTNEQNHAARRVLEKTGAVFVESRTHTLPNGSAVPSLWYAYEAPCAVESKPETATQLS